MNTDVPVAEALAVDATDAITLEIAGDRALAHSGTGDSLDITVAPDRISAVLKALKSDPRTRFDYLQDMFAVDYSKYPGREDDDERYGIIFVLFSFSLNRRLRVRCHLDERAPSMATCIGVFPACNWHEREMWDQFGIRFVGHPDLRRMFNPDHWTCHPLRKDYPLKGKGERYDFPVIERDGSVRPWTAELAPEVSRAETDPGADD